MKLMIATSLVSLALVAAAPAFVQGVYVGPGGVGVDTGIHRRDYDRDRYRPYRDDEGRSVYREHRHDRDSYDR